MALGFGIGAALHRLSKPGHDGQTDDGAADDGLPAGRLEDRLSAAGLRPGTTLDLTGAPGREPAVVNVSQAEAALTGSAERVPGPRDPNAFARLRRGMRPESGDAAAITRLRRGELSGDRSEEP